MWIGVKLVRLDVVNNGSGGAIVAACGFIYGRE